MGNFDAVDTRRVQRRDEACMPSRKVTSWMNSLVMGPPGLD